MRQAGQEQSERQITQADQGRSESSDFRVDKSGKKIRNKVNGTNRNIRVRQTVEEIEACGRTNRSDRRRNKANQDGRQTDQRRKLNQVDRRTEADRLCYQEERISLKLHGRKLA